jgi:His-Xaa-Ser system protein HxsD
LKTKKNEPISIRVSLKERDLDAVRYAAYAVSDAAYVFIAPAGGKAVRVELTAKTAAQAPGLARRFAEELADERLRARIFDANRELREFMIMKALSGEQAPAAAPEDSGLTPEQEKELDALIAQVEKEIKKESAGGGKDPLGITSTWEEKYGAKTGRKK